MRRVLLLPEEAQPALLELPQRLARVAGLVLRLPPPTARSEWLWREAPAADVLLASIEALGSGTGVRLELLRDLKRAHPHLRILAYGRIGPSVGPSEPYYREWRRFSEWSDRLACAEALGQDTRPAQIELDRVRLHLPKEVVQRWQEERERNHRLHLAALELLHQGVLEYLAFALEQPTPFGLPAREARRLSARLGELGLWGEADVFPGARVAPLLLLARALVNHAGRRTRVFLRFAFPKAEEARLLELDRSLGALLPPLLRAAGCVRVQGVEEADLVLAVNAPGLRQGMRQPDPEGVDTPERYLPELADRLVVDQAAGRMVAVADVAYLGQAEKPWVELMLSALNPSVLAGYAAWGSADCSLGVALAAGVCALFGDDPVPLAEFNFLRLVEDWLYAAQVHPQVALDLRVLEPGSDGFVLAAERLIDQRLEPLAQDLWQRFFAPSLPGVRLEWGRPRLAGPYLDGVSFPLRLAREG
ncbi:DUF4127 family protein [Meiothermus sp. QL-1]|uniref:DUF4127 family protein n=1 Tax=Meiothermus sp. QL-1 TaxID=2058095 RepID=UPI000E0A5BC6|nr:DUF4127 family protein [Meiothermus sp. QL-1]RDI94970.1 DUF4127 family protein [Meiothermus sp. QL-1]